MSSSTKPGEQPVPDEIRDQVFASIRHINNNNICLDCQKKNPKWTSIHLGIHLCIDCAGKHRQYGVIYSFVKSANLDAWNQKQILFMQKGGNSRALQYFRKGGIITNNNSHIDYKSPVVQNYKNILTAEVEAELTGVSPAIKTEKSKQSEKDDFFSEKVEVVKKEEEKKELPQAEVVESQQPAPKKKKDKKKIGAKMINLQDFESLQFDDGVPTSQKQKIVKEYEKQKDQPINSSDNTVTSQQTHHPPAVAKIEEPKQLSAEQINKKLQQLKAQSNLKTISSDSFKDTSIDNVVLKQNLNKFSNSSSISSNAFFNKEEEKGGETMEKIKDIVSGAGQKIFSKITSYWNKG